MTETGSNPGGGTNLTAGRGPGGPGGAGPGIGAAGRGGRGGRGSNRSHNRGQMNPQSGFCTQPTRPLRGKQDHDSMR